MESLTLKTNLENNGKQLDEFDIQEIHGRTLLKSLLDQLGATDQRESPIKGDVPDYYFTYKGKKVIAEIKCRNPYYESFSTHVIEERKFNSLLEEKIKNNCDTIAYFNFFGDDTVYLYKESDIAEHATEAKALYDNATAEWRGKRVKKLLNIPRYLAQIFKRNPATGLWYYDGSNKIAA